VKRESISNRTSYSELDLSIRKGKKTDIVVFESGRERTSHSFESLEGQVNSVRSIVDKTDPFERRAGIEEER
jgi:hypothetical protein